MPVFRAYSATVGPVLRSEYAHCMGSRMAQPVSSRQLPGVSPPGRGIAPALVVAGAGLGAVLLLGALLLWFHYGTAVFFEMVAAGISACF